jgi:O-antigen/teichoic acid export membrane protein
MNESLPAPPSTRQPIAAGRALWSALDAAATPVATLATLAALVRALSATEYGVLVVAFAASALSMAVNPAIAATTTKFVSELSGEQYSGRRSVARVVTVSLLMVAVIDLVLLLGTAAFNESLSLWIFGPAIGGTPHAGRVLLLAVLSLSIQQIEAVLSAAIKGLERFRRQAMMEMFSRVTLTAIIIYVAWYTHGIEAILFAQCAAYSMSTLVRGIALSRLLPEKRLFQRPDSAEAVRLIRYSGWMWLTALAGVAYTSADRIIVGRSLGVAAAGQYNIYLQIAQVIHFIPSSVFAFSLPAFSRLAAQGGTARAEIAQVYRTYLILICATAFILAAAIAVSWPLLLRIFTGAGLAAGPFGAARLLTLNFALLACNVAPYYLLIALGHAKTVSVITTGSMLAALLLMALLIPRYGLEGAALARLAYGFGALMLLERAQRLLKWK